MALMVSAVLVMAVAASGAGGSLVGTWSRVTTCAEQLKALSRPGMERWAVEMVVGNGFIPGARSVSQLKDPAHPCKGAVPRKHSHFFTKDGRFGSLDWNGEPVDDGTYKVMDNKLVISKEFPRVTFTFTIRDGKTVMFTPVIPKGCSTFRCAWSVSMAFPGKPWSRTRP
jgi:hypothetical protein